MCGRFAQKASEKELEHFYKAKNIVPFEPNYNIAPQTNIQVVLLSKKSGNREIHLLRWGLIPSWAKDDSFSAKCINARSETIKEKASFRESFKKRRCLVPVTGFYEWKKDGKIKTPYFIKPKEGMFSLAGVWATWRSKAQDETINTVAILTIGANPALRNIHHRVPVNISENEFEQWLDPNIEGKDIESMLQPLQDDGIEFWEVDKRVNNAANNDPSLINK